MTAEPVTAVPVQPKAALRYVGRKPFNVDRLYHTGVIWHGYGDVEPIADPDVARRMAANHPDAYEFVEIDTN